MRKLEGTAIAELVEGGKLKCADVLLEHSKGSLWGWLIRLGTRNYWNHALMVVCSVEGTGEGNENTLVIDPRMGGIHTVNMLDYFKALKKYDVAVKRLETDWFQDESQTGGWRFRRMVSDFALGRAGDKSTARSSLGSVRRMLRRLSIIYRFLSRKRQRPRQEKTQRTAGPLNLNTYACSGVVQWSYYRGVFKITAEDGLPEGKVQEVTFSPQLETQPSDADLLSITPADLAVCDRLSWKYVIKDGVVWEVSSEEEVNSIVESGKAQR